MVEDAQGWVSVTEIIPQTTFFSFRAGVELVGEARTMRKTLWAFWKRIRANIGPWSSPGNCGGRSCCVIHTFKPGTKYQVSTPMMRHYHWRVKLLQLSRTTIRSQTHTVFKHGRKPADANCAGGQVLQELNSENADRGAERLGLVSSDLVRQVRPCSMQFISHFKLFESAAGQQTLKRMVEPSPCREDRPNFHSESQGIKIFLSRQDISDAKKKR